MCAQSSTRAVLVVEDEPLLRLDIVENFMAAGFRAFEAASALEAIEILQSHPEIRAVFTDVEMPGTMDGIELAHVVRRALAPDHPCGEFRAQLPCRIRATRERPLSSPSPTLRVRSTRWSDGLVANSTPMAPSA